VIADLVVNHTSTQHPWFQSARSDPESPYRDWYVWLPEKPEQEAKVIFPDEEAATGSGMSRPGCTTCTVSMRSSRTSTSATPRWSRRSTGSWASGSQSLSGQEQKVSLDLSGQLRFAALVDVFGDRPDDELSVDDPEFEIAAYGYRGCGAAGRTARSASPENVCEQSRR